MITLPKSFAPIDYPGYFWCTERKKLFSIKVTGQIKELTLYRPDVLSARYKNMTGDYYILSHENKPVWVSRNSLTMSRVKDVELPVKEFGVVNV
jgi:hypothetical protein